MPTLLLLTTLGCAERAFTVDPRAPTSTPQTGDTGMVQPPLEEGWYSLDGAFLIEQGQVLQGSITISLWKKDARGRPELFCSSSLPLEALPSAQPPPGEEPLYGLWEVQLDVVECFGAPTQVSIGIGPLPTVLWPTVEAQGNSTRHTRGLYTIVGSDLVVFGTAGTAAQLKGLGAPTTLHPLPDGDYALASAYLLTL